MKGLFLYCFVFVFIVKINAQVNLVPNPSFETYTTCPTGASQISLAIPWQGVTTNSTDYWNACAIAGSSISVPSDGVWGFQYARTGNAYAGMWVINGFGGDYREYLQVKLDSTLEADSCYFVEFYCNLYNGSYFGINKMGAHLSDTAISAVGPSTWGLVLQYIPQVVSDTFLIDTLNWMKVSGYYQASGGEQYITIGNFDLDDPSDTSYAGGVCCDAYYLIDDVTVKKVIGCDTTLGINVYENNFSIKLFPNPNDGNMTLEYSLSETSTGTFMLYDVTGRLVNSYVLTSGENNSLKISESELQNGIYFYNVIIDNKVKAQNKIVIVK